jgi:hypothetical protein
LNRKLETIRALTTIAVLLVAGISLGGTTILLDFAKEKLPDGWSLGSKQWKVAEGMLRSAGDGSLDFAGPIEGDFTLTFKGWSAEKTNFEVKLVDPDEGHDLYTSLARRTVRQRQPAHVDLSRTHVQLRGAQRQGPAADEVGLDNVKLTLPDAKR